MDRSIAFDLLIWLCKAHDAVACNDELDFYADRPPIGRDYWRSPRDWLDAVSVLDNHRRSIARNYL